MRTWGGTVVRWPQNVFDSNQCVFWFTSPTVIVTSHLWLWSIKHDLFHCIKKKKKERQVLESIGRWQLTLVCHVDGWLACCSSTHARGFTVQLCLKPVWVKLTWHEMETAFIILAVCVCVSCFIMSDSIISNLVHWFFKSLAGRCLSCQCQGHLVPQKYLDHKKKCHALFGNKWMCFSSGGRVCRCGSNAQTKCTNKDCVVYKW